MRLKNLNLLKSERGIVSGSYGGYFWWTIIGMSAISAISVLSNSATLFDSIQQIIIYAGMAVSYDYFSGFTGYYNLGFGAFVAIGAYTFVATSNAGLNFFLALILAGLVSSLFAAGISYPFLRLRGAYFAIATLALVVILRLFDINLFQITSGLLGLYVKISTQGIKVPLLIGSLLFLFATLSIHYIIGRSRMGLALRSIREEEEVSESFGVNSFRMKQSAMVLSGFFGGISGSMLALYLGFINADNVLGLGIALFPVVAAMAGGTGIFLGPLVGSFLLTGVNLTLPSFIISIDPAIIFGPLAVTGVLLLFVGLLVPAGILRVKFLERYSYRKPDEFLIKALKRNSSIPQPVQRKAQVKSEG